MEPDVAVSDGMSTQHTGPCQPAPAAGQSDDTTRTAQHSGQQPVQGWGCDSTVKPHPTPKHAHSAALAPDRSKEFPISKQLERVWRTRAPTTQPASLVTRGVSAPAYWHGPPVPKEPGTHLANMTSPVALAIAAMLPACAVCTQRYHLPHETPVYLQLNVF
jgi:hypothetical protein